MFPAAPSAPSGNQIAEPERPQPAARPYFCALHRSPGDWRGRATGPSGDLAPGPLGVNGAPGRKATSHARGGRGNGAPAGATSPLSASKETRRQSRSESRPDATAPARAAFKLRVWRPRSAPLPREPARAARPISAGLPAAACQWRRAFLGRGEAGALRWPPVCGLGLVLALRSGRSSAQGLLCRLAAPLRVCLALLGPAVFGPAGGLVRCRGGGDAEPGTPSDRAAERATHRGAARAPRCRSSWRTRRS